MSVFASGPALRTLLTPGDVKSIFFSTKGSFFTGSDVWTEQHNVVENDNGAFEFEGTPGDQTNASPLHRFEKALGATVGKDVEPVGKIYDGLGQPFLLYAASD